MPDPSSRLQRRACGLIKAAAGFRLLALLVAALASVTPTGVLADGSGTGPPLLRVRTLVAQTAIVAAAQVLTGDIQPRCLSEISFRTNGKIASRAVDIGRHVAPDEVLATLDPASQQSNLQDARAALASAQAQLTQAQPNFARQRALPASGGTTCIIYDNAEQSLRTAVAGMATAKAGLGAAEGQFGFTSLRSGAAGVMTRRGAEVGQVVQAGQAVFILAQDGPRDAVFDVHEALLAETPDDRGIDVALQADPAVHVSGEVREFAPVMDAGSGTVKVRIGGIVVATALTPLFLPALYVGCYRIKAPLPGLARGARDGGSKARLSKGLPASGG